MVIHIHLVENAENFSACLRIHRSSEQFPPVSPLHGDGTVRSDQRRIQIEKFCVGTRGTEQPPRTEHKFYSCFSDPTDHFQIVIWNQEFAVDQRRVDIADDQFIHWSSFRFFIYPQKKGCLSPAALVFSLFYSIILLSMRLDEIALI